MKAFVPFIGCINVISVSLQLAHCTIYLKGVYMKVLPFLMLLIPIMGMAVPLVEGPRSGIGNSVKRIDQAPNKRNSNPAKMRQNKI